MKVWLARGIVFSFVGLAILVRNVGSWLRRKSKNDENRPFRVFLIGAFDSAGWIRAHAGPLVHCRTVDEVYVICDEPFNLNLQGVTFCCVSPRVRRWVGRGGGRLWVLFNEASRLRPQIFMGYHIMPNAPLALLASGLFGGKAIYQMTGGPIQVEGGGYRSENPLLRRTGSASWLQERLMLRLLRSCDRIVVRGSQSLEFLRAHGLEEKCFVITGAIDTDRFRPCENETHRVLVSVARLVENKGVEEFLLTVRELAREDPAIRALLVGGGGSRGAFEELVRDWGIERNVEFCGKLADVVPVLQKGSLFFLLSPSEGMSIAMLEAMACGLPPVVLNVGDLGDAVTDGLTGMIFDGYDPGIVAGKVRTLLNDPGELRKMASGARDMVFRKYSVEAIAKRWDENLAVICD